MSGCTFWKHLSLITVAATIVPGIVIPAGAQTQAVESKQTAGPIVAQKSPRGFEDGEMRLEIPAGWTLSNTKEKPSEGTLLLEKDRYRLSLGYHVGQASGIVGGRFIEAFAMNWPGLDDAWNCSLYLREYPQPASRNLLFVNLIIDSGKDKVRENCGIPKNLGYWTVKDGTKQYEGELRWFGGYFREAYGGYFFGPDGDGCAEKVYTFTFQADSPERLPIAESPLPDNNAALEKIINEAIDIVNSIHYKRCVPW
jgi:hypothetical protein